MSPPYCRPLSLAEGPRSLSSVSVSPLLTAGVAGGQLDTRCLEMVRAQAGGRAALGTRPCRAAESPLAPLGCAGAAPPLGGAGPAGRAAVLSFAESSVLWDLGSAGCLQPASLQSGRCRQSRGEPWVWARVRGFEGKPRGGIKPGSMHVVKKKKKVG